MILTVDKAKELLIEAEKLNPGGWVGHSLNVGLAARNIAEKCPHLDADKAHAFAIVHDIGRRVGVVQERHTIEGYNYLMDLGYTDAARICLTHANPTGNVLDSAGKWDCSSEDFEFVRNFIENCEFDDYDKLCQLSDTLALDYGFILIEKRLFDVGLRYGFNDFTQQKWKAFMDLKSYFENIIGCSIYDLLPGIEENTFKK